MECRKCGKEIKNVSVNASSERIVNKISFWDNIRLAVQTLISTPSKFILLFIITMFFTLFLFFGSTTYLYMDTVAKNLVETGTSADFSTYNSRIVIRKENNQIFNQEDIDYLKSIKNVSAIIENDIFFDSKLYYAFDEDVDYNSYSSPILPAENLEFTDLLWGRLPKNENEVVLAKGVKYLNKTVYVAADGDETPRVCKVVGLVPQTEDDTIYVHNSIVDTVVERVEMNSTMIYFQIIPASNALAMLARNYDWYIDETLNDNQIVVESHTTKSSSGEADLDTINYGKQDFYFESNGEKLMVDNVEFIYRKYTYTAKEYSSMSGKEYVYNVCVRTNTPSSNGYLSPNNYKKLMDFKKLYFQISALADSEDNVAKVVEEIEKKDYFCSAKALIQNEDQVLLATGFETIVAGAIIVIVFGLSLIVYAVLKNVLNSQQKTFLIMRSLGIDGKNITSLIFIELAFTLVINFILIFIIWFIFKIRNIGGFFTGIHNSSIGVVLLIYAITIIVFGVLGFKYSITVNSSAIVNKEME